MFLRVRAAAMALRPCTGTALVLSITASMSLEGRYRPEGVAPHNTQRRYTSSGRGFHSQGRGYIGQV
eukprot:4397498-Pyramimonas_sp.AAC.1